MKIGAAFPDFITTEPRRNFSSKGRSAPASPAGGSGGKGTRDFFLVACLILGIGVILFKLFFLQILQGSYHRGLSNNNRIKTVVIHAPRGSIFDRNGKSLVFNIPGFRKTVKGPAAAGSRERDKTVLIGQDEAITLLAKGSSASEGLEYDSLRQYPYGETFSHVLGYTGQISEDELKSERFQSYSGGDIIGKMGIEQYFENTLKGWDGKQLIEVDSLGNTIRKLGQTDPVQGNNITLNLDLNLQKAAFTAMKDVQKGAVVVSTLKGEILTLISKPSFDPNLFTLQGEETQARLQSILFDPTNKALLNRAISGTYPPGSTFKLVVAASGLENKIIDEDYKVNDTGVLNIGTFSFSNWYFTQYGKTEGEVNVVKGIKRSTDTFFYKLAEDIGVDKISEMAKKFGLGKALGIDLFGEEDGLVPTPQWKEKQIGEPWYLGDTYHYGIGQGYVLATPLQVNAWTSVIANGGDLYQPRLVKNSKFEIRNSKFLSEKTISLIREGMVQSCSPGGVAWPLFEFSVKNPRLKIDGKNFNSVPQATISANFKDYRKVTIACKTGTAQHGDINTEPHAWITLFAPAYNPQIVVTVLAEESGEGSNVAAPIAKKILEEWFSR